VITLSGKGWFGGRNESKFSLSEGVRHSFLYPDPSSSHTDLRALEVGYWRFDTMPGKSDDEFYKQIKADKVMAFKNFAFSPGKPIFVKRLT